MAEEAEVTSRNQSVAAVVPRPCDDEDLPRLRPESRGGKSHGLARQLHQLRHRVSVLTEQTLVQLPSLCLAKQLHPVNSLLVFSSVTSISRTSLSQAQIEFSYSRVLLES